MFIIKYLWKILILNNIIALFQIYKLLPYTYKKYSKGQGGNKIVINNLSLAIQTTGEFFFILNLFQCLLPSYFKKKRII